MATTINEVDAPAAATPTPAAPQEPARTPAGRSLLVVGSISAALLTGALVFGGGVLLGANLHAHEPRPGIAEQQLPGVEHPSPSQPGSAQQDDRRDH